MYMSALILKSVFAHVFEFGSPFVSAKVCSANKINVMPTADRAYVDRIGLIADFAHSYSPTTPDSCSPKHTYYSHFEN